MQSSGSGMFCSPTFNTLTTSQEMKDNYNFSGPSGSGFKEQLAAEDEVF